MFENLFKKEEKVEMQDIDKIREVDGAGIYTDNLGTYEIVYVVECPNCKEKNIELPSDDYSEYGKCDNCDYKYLKEKIIPKYNQYDVNDIVSHILSIAVYETDDYELLDKLHDILFIEEDIELKDWEYIIQSRINDLRELEQTKKESEDKEIDLNVKVEFE